MAIIKSYSCFKLNVIPLMACIVPKAAGYCYYFSQETFINRIIGYLGMKYMKVCF